MKFVVFSLGCRVNQYEGQSMVKKFIERGFDASDKLEYADAYVINTCSVTSEADKKSRQAVARVKKLNPNAKVFILGCSSQNNSKPFTSANCECRPSAVRVDRLKKIAEEASKQCGRGIIPNISEVMDFGALVGELKQYDLIVFPYENAKETKLGDAESRACPLN